MVDKTYRDALADNELVPGTPGVGETQITGLEVFGATTNTPFTDAGLTFNSLKGWIFADPDTMLKSVYDIDDDGIVDKSETIDDGAGNAKTAAEVAGHIDTTNIHTVLNDLSTTNNNLWSADKINTEVSAKADQTAFNAHVSDLSIHRALNDSVTTTTTLWSGFKINNEIQVKVDQTDFDSHVNDLDIHRTLNDGVTTVTNLWSASKINADISVKADIAALNAHITDTNNPHNTIHAQVAPGITFDHAAIDLHIPNNSHLSANERAAFDNAPNPATGANPLATQADITGGSKHIIQDDGVGFPSRTNLNFTGTGVVVSDDFGADATVVNIAGVGGDLSNAIFPTYAVFDEEYDNGNSGASITIDFALGNKQKVTLNDNAAITFTGVSTRSAHFQVKVIQDATGGRTPTIVNAYKKLVGSTLSWSSAANAEDLLNIYFDGTGFYIQQTSWEAA